VARLKGFSTWYANELRWRRVARRRAACAAGDQRTGSGPGEHGDLDRVGSSGAGRASATVEPEQRTLR
jgi:hypothetical protein